MSNKLQDIILSSKLGRIGGLAFSVYIFIWAIIEPLGLDWIECNKTIWRVILISLSAIVTTIFSIRLYGSLLDKIDTNGPDRTLQDSYSSTGNPKLTIQQDGNLGNVLHITGQYHEDEIDWAVKSSAQTATKLELIFKNNGLFYFYLRVIMVSQNGQTYSIRWIRFDNSMGTPDIFIKDPQEMGIHYDCDPYKTFNKTVINIPDAVKKTYGQAGWKFEKSILFRVRCNDGTIKSVVFIK